MAGKPPNGDMGLELTGGAGVVTATRHNPTARGAATTRLDYGDSAFCYGSIDARLDVVKEPLEDVSDTMIQCDVLNVSDSTTHVSGGSELTSDADTVGGLDDDPCGWGPIQPPWCQGLRNPKVFLFCLCWAGAIQVRQWAFR